MVKHYEYIKILGYLFDFDPSRTLIIFDEFANNLCVDMISEQGMGEERKDNIRRLLNFFSGTGRRW